MVWWKWSVFKKKKNFFIHTHWVLRWNIVCLFLSPLSYVYFISFVLYATLVLSHLPALTFIYLSLPFLSSSLYFPPPLPIFPFPHHITSPSPPSMSSSHPFLPCLAILAFLTSLPSFLPTLPLRSSLPALSFLPSGLLSSPLSEKRMLCGGDAAKKRGNTHSLVPRKNIPPVSSLLFFPPVPGEEGKGRWIGNREDRRIEGDERMGEISLQCIGSVKHGSFSAQVWWYCVYLLWYWFVCRYVCVCVFL